MYCSHQVHSSTQTCDTVTCCEICDVSLNVDACWLLFDVYRLRHVFTAVLRMFYFARQLVVHVNVQLYAEHQTTFSLHLAFVLETWRIHGIGICLIVYR